MIQLNPRSSKPLILEVGLCDGGSSLEQSLEQRPGPRTCLLQVCAPNICFYALFFLQRIKNNKKGFPSFIKRVEDSLSSAALTCERGR